MIFEPKIVLKKITNNKYKPYYNITIFIIRQFMIINLYIFFYLPLLFMYSLVKRGNTLENNLSSTRNYPG